LIELGIVVIRYGFLHPKLYCLFLKVYIITFVRYKEFQTSLVNECDKKVFPFIRDTMTLDESRASCLNMLESPYVLELIETLDFVIKPCENINVITGDKRRKNVGSTNQCIILPKGCRNSAMLCHEVSHTLTLDSMERPPVAFHGQEFCFVYINLLRRFMGDDFAQTLIDEYVLIGVEF
jgi:hypothetical protein